MYPNDTYFLQSHRRQEFPWVATSAAIIATTVVSTFLYPLVNEHGWKGALAYVWEGDPLPPATRGRKDALDKVDRSLRKKENLLSRLEEGLERASLDSVDGASAGLIRTLWQENVPKDLRQTLALLSHDLDQLASAIDQVTVSDLSSSNSAIIKAQKKALSTRVVALMGRADVLITFFKNS